MTLLLSRWIDKICNRDKLTRRGSSSFSICHLLFVDDVLIFGDVTVSEWKSYKYIFEVFCNVTSMVLSIEKSRFLSNCIDTGCCEQIKSLLPFKMEKIDSNFKYLGYYLKGNEYET